MFNGILEKKPPNKYEEGFFRYSPGLDTFPEDIHFILAGFTFKEIEKMHKLYFIEFMKYQLEESKDTDEDVSPEEIEEGKMRIAELIAQYNESP